jgi:hypothetical protein
MSYLHRTVVVLTLAVSAFAGTGNAWGGELLSNPSFEIGTPGISSTTFTGMRDLGGTPSAAQDWRVFNNSYGTTTTELLPSTLVGGGSEMLHVTTTNAYNGIYQIFLPANTGPSQVLASLSVFVLSGEVGMGTGNGGSTSPWNVVSHTTGQWETLSATTTGLPGSTPANEIVLYSVYGPADFYVDMASVHPRSDGGTGSAASIASAPEPSTLISLGAGALMSLAGYSWRRKRAHQAR